MRVRLEEPLHGRALYVAMRRRRARAAALSASTALMSAKNCCMTASWRRSSLPALTSWRWRAPALRAVKSARSLGPATPSANLSVHAALALAARLQRQTSDLNCYYKAVAFGMDSSISGVMDGCRDRLACGAAGAPVTTPLAQQRHEAMRLLLQSQQ